MMTDDSDGDTHLLSQFHHSRSSVEVNCSFNPLASGSLHKHQDHDSNFSAHEDLESGPKPLSESSKGAGLLLDGSTSPTELLPVPGRSFAQKEQAVKVYMKRKKQPDNENQVEKRPKFSRATNNGSIFASTSFGKGNGLVLSSKSVSSDNINEGTASIDDGRHREHDIHVSVDTVALGSNLRATLRGNGDKDSGGGTRFESAAMNVTDGKDITADDPRASCNLTKTQFSLSIASKVIVSDNKAQEDDDLPLIKLSLLKKRKVSASQGLFTEGEKLEGNSYLSKMPGSKKTKGSTMNGGQVVYNQSAVKEEGHHSELREQIDVKLIKQPAKNLPDVSETKRTKLGQVERKQLCCMAREEEDDDSLTLVQMSRLKRKEHAFAVQSSAEKCTIKEQEGSKRDSVIVETVLRKHLSKETISDNSSPVSEGKLCDIASLGKQSHKNIENVAIATKVHSTKVTDASVGVVCKSRAKQLMALSRALEETDSEDDTQNIEEIDDTGETEEEKEEEEDQDDDDDDDDYSGVKSAKDTRVKSKNRAKTPAITTKKKALGRSKASGGRSPKKVFETKKTYDNGSDDQEDVDDVEEEDNDDDEEFSQEEDDEWEDDGEYDVLKVSKRRKKVSGIKNSAQQKKGRKRSKKMNDAPGAGGGQKWTTLQHNGIMFPPYYEPHGIKMLYKGNPVDLTLEQEEVATMFAVMKETDYAAKPKFLANFWNDWKKLLGPNHIIQNLEDCNFTPIYEWNLSEKEKKKQMSSQEKKSIKEEKLQQEEKYMWAVVDGVKEKVGNFRVEPPGLFRGRGEHPKMGKLKRRIYPEDIVINVGADSPVPECSLPGHRWKEVRHDDTVTWLAYWNDPINVREQKYVFLAASSALKGQSDKEKYEKARVLKDYIEDIRKTYTQNFTSTDPTSRQIAVATYLIDQLALRAGNEKDDDEADTVGCCSLKVEHVTLIPPTSLEFDFLGKDSIRYFNVLKVVKPVYEAVGDFKDGKILGSDLFDRLDTNKLNAHLKSLMPQLTAKVFRTYNASITLDNLLLESGGQLLAEKIAGYQRANKEVAILCNHQRSVSKTHGAQMERLEGKLTELSDLVDELEKDLERARMGIAPLNDSEGNGKKNPNPDVLQKKILQTKQKMERMTLDMKIKEDLKTVALGTSKINYMDPRITVAWCKNHEVPIEKIFNKSLLGKFAWAMDVDMHFRF